MQIAGIKIKKERLNNMTRNECIDQCVDIWNGQTISDEDKEETITGLLLASEEKFGKGKARKLLKVLKAKGVTVSATDLWNEIRQGALNRYKGA